MSYCYTLTRLREHHVIRVRLSAKILVLKVLLEVLRSCTCIRMLVFFGFLSFPYPAW